MATPEETKAAKADAKPVVDVQAQIDAAVAKALADAKVAADAEAAKRAEGDAQAFDDAVAAAVAKVKADAEEASAAAIASALREPAGDDTAIYTALTPLEHNGKPVAVGKPVRLTDDEADPLLNCTPPAIRLGGSKADPIE